MDYLQFASQALVSGVGVAGLVLSAFHVKHAHAVANDAVATLSDAIAAMHGNLTGILSKLVAASPTLLADGMRLATDLGGGTTAGPVVTRATELSLVETQAVAGAAKAAGPPAA